MHAFAFFGGVPQSVLYDNDRCLVSRILADGTRRRARLFNGFLSHYLVRDRYGRPGKGNDKGAVEGLVGFSRRNFMVPLPRFASPYKRFGVEKGDELRVAGIDRKAGIVNLTGKDGDTVAWEPGRLAARTGGVEVYGVDIIELRRGDRVRWTRNDATHGLVNSGTAEVTAVKDGKIALRLEDGRGLETRCESGWRPAPGSVSRRPPERGKAAEAGSDKTRERERGPGVQEARPPIPKAVPQVPEREQAPRERKPEPEKVREGPELELDLGL